DLLHEVGAKVWQILPLNACDYNPYSAFSSFAGNPLLISPELLLKTQVITRLPPVPWALRFSSRVNFLKVWDYKKKIFSLIAENTPWDRDSEFSSFCEKHVDWLDDYALFIALRAHLAQDDWHFWPSDLVTHHPEIIQQYRHKLEKEILLEKYLQHLFFKQWFALKTYAHRKGIKILGDIPIYCNRNGCDIWSHPQYFKLGADRRPSFFGGTPPDCFSAQGQVWRNPVFNWEHLHKVNFSWWNKRFEHNLGFFDFIRLDHFQGLVSYWEIPATMNDAAKGYLVEVPTAELFTALSASPNDLPIVVENLGFMPPRVEKIIERYQFPGMHVLLYAFDSDEIHSHSPQKHQENALVYTGTHDNDTVLGWWKGADIKNKKRLLNSIKLERISQKQVPQEMIKLALSSKASWAIIPLQDFLSLDSRARMNHPELYQKTPGVRPKGVWDWRVSQKSLKNKDWQKFYFELIKKNNRG
ncbi:MAG: 4-alpha-glucanotransferase, partial [Pseudomonadota bacterium]